MRKGFTLIELLVVVLIIGILASVALPQYFKSVEKSRISEVIEFTRAYTDAQDRYWMKTGSYARGPNRMQKLDIDYPNNEPQLAFFDIDAAVGTGLIFQRKTSVPIFGKYTIEISPTDLYTQHPFKVVTIYCMNDKNKQIKDCYDWLKSALKPN